MVDLYGKKIDLQYLPVLPAALNKLIDIVNDSNLSNKEIAKIVSLDSGIAAKVLSIANSALFGGSVPISDLTIAVTRLGRNDVKTIAMTVYISQVLKKFPLKNVLIEQFWQHSLSVAFLSRKITKFYNLRSGISDEEQNYLYLSALMHDLGYVILDLINPDKFNDFMDYSKKNNVSLVRAEREIFHTSHSEEASKLLKYWRLPNPIIEIMKNHHTPEDANQEYQNLANVIHVADYLANMFNYSVFKDFPHEQVDSTIYSLFKFSENEEENFVIEELRKQTELFLNFSELTLSV